MDLHVPFRLRDLDGAVSVDMHACSHPDQSGLLALDDGLPDDGLGLPICTATVSYPGHGYLAAMGWVQLVRSDDGGDPTIFEPDPLALLKDANTPYAFFGIRPIMFDAPYRPRTAQLRWQARSYLAVSPDSVLTRAARPIAAFSWGFCIAGGEITLDDPAALALDTWTEHVRVLSEAYPGWVF